MRIQHESPRYTLVYHDADRHLASFAEEVASGLTSRPKILPCRFLYDEMGSKLFEEICGLPEYYLTRAEREILSERADEIAAVYDRPVQLVELGSGSSAKTRLLIESLLRRHGELCYVPIDISQEMLRQSAVELLDDYEALEVRAIASEYEEGLRHVPESDAPKLVLWLGSSIGNFYREESERFLSSLTRTLRPGDGLLLGVDLRKQKGVLEAAYDDAAGVTARFSLNLLERMNRELGADFDPGAFRHEAVYHEAEGQVKIQIVSQRAQRVTIEDLELEVDFAAGEGIYTEDSFKYSLEEIDALAARTGLGVARRWLDARGRFSLSLLTPA